MKFIVDHIAESQKGMRAKQHPSFTFSIVILLEPADEGYLREEDKGYTPEKNIIRDHNKIAEIFQARTGHKDFCEYLSHYLSTHEKIKKPVNVNYNSNGISIECLGSIIYLDGLAGASIDDANSTHPNDILDALRDAIRDALTKPRIEKRRPADAKADAKLELDENKILERAQALGLVQNIKKLGFFDRFIHTVAEIAEIEKNNQVALALRESVRAIIDSANRITINLILNKSFNAKVYRFLFDYIRPFQSEIRLTAQSSLAADPKPVAEFSDQEILKDIVCCEVPALARIKTVNLTDTNFHTAFTTDAAATILLNAKKGHTIVLPNHDRSRDIVKCMKDRIQRFPNATCVDIRIGREIVLSKDLIQKLRAEASGEMKQAAERINPAPEGQSDERESLKLMRQFLSETTGETQRAAPPASASSPSAPLASSAAPVSAALAPASPLPDLHFSATAISAASERAEGQVSPGAEGGRSEPGERQSVVPASAASAPSADPLARPEGQAEPASEPAPAPVCVV